MEPKVQSHVQPSELSSWKVILTWLFRIITGATFIFSGFVKAVDPWGTIYKMQEYFSALHWDISAGLVEVLVFALIAFEFLAGVFVLLGCYRRGAPVMVLLFMSVMVPLTLWVWIKDPVEDCGCFGDAIKLSNAVTFWKNIIITIMGCWLVIYEKKTLALITPALQWIALVCSGVYILMICWSAYFYQPQIDFRPFPVGSALISNDDSEVRFKFIYEKNGQRKEVNEDEQLPDETDGWKFIDRIEIKDEGKRATELQQNDLTIFDGDENVTSDVISENKQLILFIPSLKNLGMSNSWIINSLASYSAKNSIDFITVASATEKEIEEWKDSSMADYPIYTADDTQIKEVVRGNPGIIYLSDGKIQWKSTLMALETADFMDDSVSPDPLTFKRDNITPLKNISYLLLAVFGVLIVFSIIPYRRLFCMPRHWRRNSKQQLSGDDMDRH